jgi:hypothetical protein
MLGAITAFALIAAPASAGVNTGSQGTRIKSAHACTMLRTPEVKVFGTPVKTAINPYLKNAQCDGVVGADPKQPPGGSLWAFQNFPSFVDAFDSSRAALEDQHAEDQLSNDLLEDVSGVGRQAYLNRTKRTVVVAASKKFAFTLGWVRAGEASLSKADEKKLLTLAKDVVSRSPK